MNDYPVYVLRPSMKRILLPKLVYLVPLGILLYVGAYLNFRFIGIQTTTLVHASILLIVFLLVAFDLLFEYRKALRLEYCFYRDRLYAGGSWLAYNAIGHIDTRRNLFDRMGGTCELLINGSVRLRHIPDSYNIYQYVQNLVNYSRQPQQRQ
jgi:hypothetical protein